MVKTQNKVAIITGAARRIGKQITSDLHAKGYDVAIHCQHSIEKAHQLKNELNHLRENSAIVISGNLVDNKTAELITTAVLSHWGRLDLLVNNASSFYATPIKNGSINNWTEHWDRFINTNLKAPFALSLAAVDSLKKHSGKIINIIDIYGLDPLIDHSIYSISKAGLVMMTKSLAKELAPEISVNGVAPGAILWPENEDNSNSAKQQAILDKTALKKIGKPRDIANAVLFLAGEGNYITGQVIKVDGGRL